MWAGMQDQAWAGPQVSRRSSELAPAWLPSCPEYSGVCHRDPEPGYFRRGLGQGTHACFLSPPKPSWVWTLATECLGLSHIWPIHGARVSLR